MFSLPLADGSRPGWSSCGAGAERLLADMARIASLRSGGDLHQVRVAIRDGVPPRSSGTALVPELFGDRVRLAAEEGVYHFFLNSAEWSGTELLMLRRILFFSPLAAVAAQGAAVLIHGGLVSRAGRGILLCGDSGIGKSTCIARLSAGWDRHCDDAAILVRHGGGYYAHPLPTWSRFRSGGHRETFASAVPVKVDRIYLLSRGKTDQASALERLEMLTGTIRCMTYLQYIFALLETRDTLRKLRRAAFEFALRVCRELPVRRLGLAPHGDPESALEADLAEFS